ncbi:MAG: SPOR domain-containing protein, partial [Bacteroidales bacterium]
ADSTAIAQTEVSKKEEPTKTHKAKTDSSNKIGAQQDENNQIKTQQEKIQDSKIGEIAKVTDTLAKEEQSSKNKTATIKTKLKAKFSETAKTERRRETTAGIENLGIQIDGSENASIHYNKENPIPSVSAKDHSGLVYKVQIAAFRNRVDAEVFKGIDPLSTERSENNRWIRYMAGNFTEYQSALEARNRLRNLKYSDAFVVAYLNGKRISVSRARDLELRREPAIAVAQPSAQEKEAEREETSRQETQAVSSTEQPESNSNNSTYFTVQVGVFSQPRTAEQLYNVKDLFNDRLNNGYYRYYSGHYASRDRAGKARDVIRAKGFTDAFIVPMQNMERISMQQAVNAASSRAEENTADEVKEPADPKITFSIQIGAYRERLNNSILNMFERRSGRDINHYTKPNGIHIYSIGSYSSITEAEKELQNIKNAGFEDAFVIAVSGNKRISMEQARRLLKR